MIDKIYCWSNGQVMVFDEGGKQIPEYQDEEAIAMPKLIADAPVSARWYRGLWLGPVAEWDRPRMNGRRVIWTRTLY